MMRHTDLLLNSILKAEDRPELLFRCCSCSSAGRLVSGKRALVSNNIELTATELFDAFRIHRNRWNKAPTPLVSTTSNFLRALHFCLHKEKMGDTADDIEIIFLALRARPETAVYRAASLARQIGQSEADSEKLQTEYLFVSQIPEECVVHRVTLSTWRRRGRSFDFLLGGNPHPLPTLRGFRDLIVKHWKKLRRL